MGLLSGEKELAFLMKVKERKIYERQSKEMLIKKKPIKEPIKGKNEIK